MTRTAAAKSSAASKGSVAQPLNEPQAVLPPTEPVVTKTTQDPPEVQAGAPAKLTIAETEVFQNTAQEDKASAQVIALVNKLFRENRTLKEYKDSRIRSGVLLDGLTMQQRLEKEKTTGVDKNGDPIRWGAQHYKNVVKAFWVLAPLCEYFLTRIPS